MKIEAAIKPLKKILCDEDFFYQIPYYQRPYAWDKDQLSDLVDDLVNAYQSDKNEDYFCGSLVLIKNSDRHDVIDGQQRITTFIILSCVFRDVYRDELGDKATDYINDAIQDKYEKESKRKLKIYVDENYQNDFEQKVLHRIEIDKNKTTNKSIKTKYSGNKYLQNAHYLRNFINEKIKGTEGNRPVNPNDFVKWMFEHTVLTRIICSGQNTAIQIFNVLNDRGMSLSSVDILKSSLMHKLSNEDRKSFKANWDSIKEKIEDNGFSMENLFTAYLYYTTTINPKTTLHKELLETFKDKGSLEIINDLKAFSNSYINILNKKDRHIYCLKYLKHTFYWQTILTTAEYNKEYQDIEELKRILVAYYYKHWITGATSARIKQTSFNVLKEVKKGATIDKVKSIIKENLDKHVTTSIFENALGSDNVYDEAWCKPLLLLLEYFYKDDSNQSFIALDGKTQIEHILPQTPSTNWPHFSDDDREKTKNALGNLTLLSRRKNIQASNGTFDQKREVYISKDNQATSFELTRRLFAEYNEWNIKNLEKRQAALIKDITDRLTIIRFGIQK